MYYREMSAEALSPEMMEEGLRAMSSYAAAMHEAGVLLSADVFQPSTSSTTVRSIDGFPQTQDGAPSESADQLAGLIVIEVPGRDAAIEWAGRAPAAQWGAVEVRPSATHTVDGVWLPST
jgi:hypothetical protein